MIEDRSRPKYTEKETNEAKSIDSSIVETIIHEARQKAIKIIADANKGAEGILEDAYKRGNEEIRNAEKEAKEILHQAKKDGYKTGYENGKKNGYEEGYNNGYKTGYEEGEKESEKLIQDAINIKNQYIEIRNKALHQAEKDIIDLVISIYEKVLYQKVEEDKELIVSLVLKGIENLEISEELTIIVSKDDYEVVKNAENLILSKASLIKDLDIRINSDMKKGDCMLETTMGSVDVGLQSQLDEVKDLLTNILSNE